MKRVKISVSLDSEVVEMLKFQANVESMQVSPYLQVILRAHFGMSKMLQPTTKQVQAQSTKLEQTHQEIKKMEADKYEKIRQEWSDDE